MKFKGGEFRFKQRFSHIEFDVSGVEGRAIGKLTANDCLVLGKYLMDAYYSRTFRPKGAGEDESEPLEQ